MGATISLHLQQPRRIPHCDKCDRGCTGCGCQLVADTSAVEFANFREAEVGDLGAVFNGHHGMRGCYAAHLLLRRGFLPDI